MSKVVHLAKLPASGLGEAYTACSLWYKKPYTLLTSAVTCKRCIRMIKKKERDNVNGVKKKNRQFGKKSIQILSITLY